MKEKEIEDIVCKVPSLIEDGLTLKGRQIHVGGKYVDLLFLDKYGHELIIELKAGTIVRKHVAQLLDYEGYFLNEGSPNVRVMLVGTRVPENLRRSLDHHGFEWKELTISELVPYMNEEQISATECIAIQPRKNQEIAESHNRAKRNFTLSSDRESFWTSLLDKTKSEIPLNFLTPSKPNAVYASAGKIGMKWAFAVKQHESWVELEIMLPGDMLKSHRVFSQLNLSKEEIESALGEKMKWEKVEGRKSCRIQSSPREVLGVEDHNQWDELHDILIRKMKNMVTVFTPYIRGV